MGLYPELPNIQTAHPRAFYYEPRHELWSNGLKKGRYMVLPQGSTVDTSVRGVWDFPAGTLFFKTFGYPDPNEPTRTIPIETRLIRRVATEGMIWQQWEFEVYEWNVEATAATRIDINPARTERQAVIDGQTITHNIPMRQDCWNCHIGNETPIIGFDELRLNSELGVEHQLQKVIDSGFLSAPPTLPWLEISDPDPLQERVFRYIHGNCVHCHNGQPLREPGARFPALDLHAETLLADTVNQPTEATGTAPGVRIIPGNPDQSVLFVAFAREGDPTILQEVKLMPLIGVDVVDQNAVQDLRDWITALEP